MNLFIKSFNIIILHVGYYDSTTLLFSPTLQNKNYLSDHYFKTYQVVLF